MATLEIILMLSNAEIVGKVEKAFKPLDCVAEICDYEHKLRFRVYSDDGDPLVTMKEAVLDELRNEDYLNSLLEQVKDLVSRKLKKNQ